MPRPTECDLDEREYSISDAGIAHELEGIIEEGGGPAPEESYDPPPQFGKRWKPPEVIDHKTTGNYRVPTQFDDLDNDPNAAPICYPDYDVKDTFVVSGPLGRNVQGHTRGRHFANYKQAREWAVTKYGRICEEYRITGKWCFRVPKPHS